jgi:hypothetical protein
MFCPGCGLKEERAVLFCRACGSDLSVVRTSLAQPDAAANSLTSAREEIARALATRIQQGEWWQTGTLVSEMAKLFESPQERRLRLLREDEASRLRRIRAGVITGAAGFGEILLCLLLSVGKPDLLLFAGPGVVVFLIGLGIVLNGLLFTVRKHSLRQSLPEDQKLDTGRLPGGAVRVESHSPARPPFLSSSVTDQTTRHLSSDLGNASAGNDV